MDINATVRAFKASSMDIECKEMVLAQRKPDGKSFKGRGHIRQMPSGMLSLKIDLIEEITPSYFEFFGTINLAERNKIVGEEDYYYLGATAQDGIRWTADWILPFNLLNQTDSGAFIACELRSICAHLPRKITSANLTLYFFENCDVPLNRWGKPEENDGRISVECNHAKFDIDDIAFCIRKNSNDTIIEAYSPKSFPVGFYMRVQEALDFMTGKLSTLRVKVETTEDGSFLELFSPSQRAFPTQFNPPLYLSSSAYYENGWGLFAAFFSYTMRNTCGFRWNPVAYHLRSACESTALSLHSWAVGCSVAVEALCNLIEMPEGNKNIVDPDQNCMSLPEVRKLMRQHVDSLTGLEEKLIDRLRGLIDTLASPRAIDKLYRLATNGYVEQTYIKPWKDLRNRNVHATPEDMKYPHKTGVQELYDAIQKTETLLNQLTLYLIGYRGPYTDHASTKALFEPYPLKGQ